MAYIMEQSPCTAAILFVSSIVTQRILPWVWQQLSSLMLSMRTIPFSARNLLESLWELPGCSSVLHSPNVLVTDESSSTVNGA